MAYLHYSGGINQALSLAKSLRNDLPAAGWRGDVKPVGHGISELRLHFGAGYRVYYYQDKDVLVLLLNGGDKSTQAQDIAKAYKIFEQWRN